MIHSPNISKISHMSFFKIRGWLVFSILVLCIPLTASFVFAGQASLGPTIAQQTQAVVNESTEAGELKKEEFLQYMRSQLDDFDTKLQELKAQSEDLRETARSELLDRLEKLQAQKQELLPKIEKATRSSEAAWTDIKDGLDRAATDLKVALEQAASNFF